MNKIFDLLNLYGIRDYCEVTCTPELLYTISFKYKGYYTLFSFFELELDMPGHYYFIQKMIEGFSDIVKAF